MTETYNMKLNIITPVIINSGEYFDFCELFPVMEQVKRVTNDLVIYQGYQIKTNELFKDMNEQETSKCIEAISIAAMMRNNNLANQRLMKIRDNLLTDLKGKVRIPCCILSNAKDLSEKPLQQVSKVMQEKISGYTYIPGSSIKGAFRTGILESLREKYSLTPNASEQDKNFESRIITANKEDRINATEDPFKYLKISDFTFHRQDGMQYISKISDGKEPKYSAMTSAYILTDKPVVAEGTITIDERFYKSLGIGNYSNLADMIGNFYVDNIAKNETKATDTMKKALNFFNDNYVGSNIPLRLGHYIGIQNYTFNVKPPRASRGKKLDIKTGGRVATIDCGIIPGLCILSREATKQ